MGAALEHLGAGATGVIVVDVDVGVAHTTSRGDERAFALAENAGEPAATELSLGALGLGLARAVADARARVRNFTSSFLHRHRRRARLTHHSHAGDARGPGRTKAPRRCDSKGPPRGQVQGREQGREQGRLERSESRHAPKKVQVPAQ